ncbi:hypothetical protein NDU88_005979 [Pleurodeles waltl]|uniref:Uncharacterized protein n=1 Tax=Pleurodeles waltl TaxID=8319 RepID=A0AAV7PGZ7_PLEWA|nr:hypothetical protein NDU88_005979 [Pleurodeles waltl]
MREADRHQSVLTSAPLTSVPGTGGGLQSSKHGGRKCRPCPRPQLCLPQWFLIRDLVQLSQEPRSGTSPHPSPRGSAFRHQAPCGRTAVTRPQVARVPTTKAHWARLLVAPLNSHPAAPDAPELPLPVGDSNNWLDIWRIKKLAAELR